MTNKYITTQILLVCLAKKQALEKDIHMQLAETIAARKNLFRQWEAFFATGTVSRGSVAVKKAA